MSRFLCCFNWKVYMGLGAVALGVLVLAPGLFWGVLPLLIVAACPISMLLMMRGMRGGQCATRPAAGGSEVRQPAVAPAGREAQLAELRERFAAVQARRDGIAAELARLEETSTPVVREAEAVARAAVERAERPTR